MCRGKATINLWGEGMVPPLCRLCQKPHVGHLYSTFLILFDWFFFFFCYATDNYLSHFHGTRVSFWLVWDGLGVNGHGPDDWCGGRYLHADFWLQKFTTRLVAQPITFCPLQHLLNRCVLLVLGSSCRRWYWGVHLDSKLDADLIFYVSSAPHVEGL